MLGKKGVVACVALVLCTGCTSGGWTQDMREAWFGAMELFRVVLCVGGAAAIVPAAILIPRRGLGNLIAGLGACLLAFVIFLSYFDFFNPNVRYAKYYHRHDFFHAFLPAKYSRELGYERLYVCSVVAQRELPGVVPVSEIRDMAAGVIKPVSSVIPIVDAHRCKDHFTTERWQAFTKDIEAIESMSRGSYFEGMHKDQGFNEAPVWTLLAGLPAGLFSANEISFALLSAFDVALQAAMFVLVMWAFGWRILILSVIFWACNAAATFYWTGGGYLAQLWLFWLIAAACFAKKRLPLVAGACLALSGLLQPYAFVLFAGPALLVAMRLLRERPVGKGMLRFFAGAAIGFFVIVPASTVLVGPTSYSAYVDRTIKYSKQPFTNQVGLSFLLSQHDDISMARLKNDDDVDPFRTWREKRVERMQVQRLVVVVAALGIAFWIARALGRNQSLWLSIALGFPLFMTLFSPSCFHLSFAMLLSFVAFARPVLGALLLLAVAAGQLVLGHVGWVDERYALLTIPFYLACLAALCACSWSWTLRSLRGSFGSELAR
jgi:hypothetical protein